MPVNHDSRYHYCGTGAKRSRKLVINLLNFALCKSMDKSRSLSRSRISLASRSRNTSITNTTLGEPLGIIIQNAFLKSEQFQA
jgi:hypothetical protein